MYSENVAIQGEIKSINPFKRFLTFDFRSKLLFTIALAVSIFAGGLLAHYPALALSASLIPFALLISIGRLKSAIIMLVLYLISFVVSTLNLQQWLPAGLASSLYLVNSFIGRFIPLMAMAYYTFASTKQSDMTEALRRAHIPQPICLAFQVMFRFFSSIIRDYKSVSETLKLLNKGPNFMLRHPLMYFEYKLVPLLMVTVQSADDVAVAAMCRGLKMGQDRTTLSKTRIRFPDIIMIALACLLLLTPLL